MHCVRPPPCTRTSVTSYLTSMRLSQPESVLWMDANVYLEFSRAEIQVQQPHGRDLPPWRGAQSVRSELMNVGGNKKVVETGTELFLIRTIEDGDHTLGLEVLWRRKGTWGEDFHLQVCFLLSQAHTFWWGFLSCWHPRLELSWHVDS